MWFLANPGAGKNKKRAALWAVLIDCSPTDPPIGGLVDSIHGEIASPIQLSVACDRNDGRNHRKRGF